MESEKCHHIHDTRLATQTRLAPIITQQLQERQQLQQTFKRLSKQQQEGIQQLTQTVFSDLPKNRQSQILCDFDKVQM